MHTYSYRRQNMKIRRSRQPRNYSPAYTDKDGNPTILSDFCMIAPDEDELFDPENHIARRLVTHAEPAAGAQISP